MLNGIGFPELLIIGVIILLVFGAGRLPEVGGAIGKSIRSFRESQKSEPEEKKDLTAPKV